MIFCFLEKRGKKERVTWSPARLMMDEMGKGMGKGS